MVTARIGTLCAMGERPDLSLLERWENEHFQQRARLRQFLSAHLDVFIGYSARARGYVAVWTRDRTTRIAAEYDLRTLMNTLDALGPALSGRHSSPHRPASWRLMRLPFRERNALRAE